MTDRPHDWHRLSPRMLLVHPVHEMLRQLPVLIGSTTRPYAKPPTLGGDVRNS